MSEPIDWRALRRRDNGSTCASSHPELISGDFATPATRRAPITAAHPPVDFERRRATWGTFAIVTIVVLLSGAAFRSGATAGDDRDPQKLARTCLQWHSAASAVVSRQVQSVRDVDLLNVSNSIDRMRRARRNCELGELAQACEDYRTVASSLPGHAMTNILFPCERLVVSSNRE